MLLPMRKLYTPPPSSVISESKMVFFVCTLGLSTSSQDPKKGNDPSFIMWVNNTANAWRGAQMDLPPGNLRETTCDRPQMLYLMCVTESSIKITDGAVVVVRELV
jgi:hypothetical protein